MTTISDIETARRLGGEAGRLSAEARDLRELYMLEVDPSGISLLARESAKQHVFDEPGPKTETERERFEMLGVPPVYRGAYERAFEVAFRDVIVERDDRPWRVDVYAESPYWQLHVTTVATWVTRRDAKRIMREEGHYSDVAGQVIRCSPMAASPAEQAEWLQRHRGIEG